MITLHKLLSYFNPDCLFIVITSILNFFRLILELSIEQNITNSYSWIITRLFESKYFVV